MVKSNAVNVPWMDTRSIIHHQLIVGVLDDEVVVGIIDDEDVKTDRAILMINR